MNQIEFNVVITDEHKNIYPHFKNWCRKNLITGNDTREVFNDCYLECAERFLRMNKKFETKQNCINYFWVALRNEVFELNRNYKKQSSLKLPSDFYNEYDYDNVDSVIEKVSNDTKKFLAVKFTSMESSNYNNHESEIETETKIENDTLVQEIFSWGEKNLTMWEIGLLKMYYLNDLTYKEMQEITEINSSTIHTIVAEAKAKIYNQFKTSFLER